MRILLTGGGTGGHITPLLAVARELKNLDPSIELTGVCEKNSKFAYLYEESPDIKELWQVQAGKLRRYHGRKLREKLADLKTPLLNTRDGIYTITGYKQALKMLKRIRPNGILIKGGFVAVPVGLAAARLKIPYITHDSDSMPGLANRIISRWALKHATGMPTEFYKYSLDKTIYTGIPLATEYAEPVSNQQRSQYRQELGLDECEHIVTVTGASLGAHQLNVDTLSVIGRLMQNFNKLGVIFIAGKENEEQLRRSLAAELLADEQRRVLIKGFVSDMWRYMGAADVVISRASATVIAELAAQAKAVILVPGQLAGGHQQKNAIELAKEGRAIKVEYGDREGLYNAVSHLLTDAKERQRLAQAIHQIAKPFAARELAELVIKEFKVESR